MGEPIPTAPTMFRVYYKTQKRQCFHGHDSLKRARADAMNLKTLPDHHEIRIFRCQDGADLPLEAE